MTVSGIVKNSFVDYPGVLSCVLFLPGCNYNCYYCHNRSLLEKEHKKLDLTSVFDFLEKRKNMLDGVVITGGEPTLQPDLIPFLLKIKEFSYKIKLDTNGSSSKVIAEILRLNLCDYFAVDYKAPKSRYKEICGTSAEADEVLKTIHLLQKSDIRFEVRTTVAPEITEEDLVMMAKELPSVPRYVLNRYRKPETFLETDREKIDKMPYTAAQINALAEKIKTYQPNVISG